MKNIAGLGFDEDAKQLMFVTKDILINTLRRDGPIAAKSFDQIHDGDLHEMSELLGTTCFLLTQGFKIVNETKDELRISCATLCWNAINTFISATSLLRDGYYLQCAILIRSILETAATAMHLFINPADLVQFRDSKLELKAIIPSAKRIVPPFGHMYGMFSDKFVHIGPLHGKLHPIGPHQEDSDELGANLTFLRFSVWLIYVTVELIFADMIQGGKYWEKIAPGQIQWRPTKATIAWQDKFLHANPPKQKA